MISSQTSNGLLPCLTTKNVVLGQVNLQGSDVSPQLRFREMCQSVKAIDSRFQMDTGEQMLIGIWHQFLAGQSDACQGPAVQIVVHNLDEQLWRETEECWSLWGQGRHVDAVVNCQM